MYPCLLVFSEKIHAESFSQAVAPFLSLTQTYTPTSKPPLLCNIQNGKPSSREIRLRILTKDAGTSELATSIKTLYISPLMDVPHLQIELTERWQIPEPKSL